MNEIAIIDKQIAEIQEREQWLATTQGKAETGKRMIELFAVLSSFGYKLPDADRELMANAWGYALRDFIAAYGFGKIKQAVVYFATTDVRDYKGFPKPVELIQAIKEIGGRDPRLIKADMEAENRKQEFESATRLELSKAWNELPEDEKIRLMKMFNRDVDGYIPQVTIDAMRNFPFKE